MNFIIVYKAPGVDWDLLPEVRGELMSLPGVVRVKRSRLYSLQPEDFEGVSRPLCVVLLRMEDRYGYEERGDIDRLEYIEGFHEVANVVSGLTRARCGNEDAHFWWAPVEEVERRGAELSEKHTPEGELLRYYNMACSNHGGE